MQRGVRATPVSPTRIVSLRWQDAVKHEPVRDYLLSWLQPGVRHKRGWFQRGHGLRSPRHGTPSPL